MQKIALKEKMIEFQRALLSQEIIELINGIRNSVRQSVQIGVSETFEAAQNKLIQSIVTSKSNYDNIVQQDNDLKKISNAMGSSLYQTETIAKLISTISVFNANTVVGLMSNTLIVDFLVFHQSLTSTMRVLFATISERQENENVIIFTLVSEQEPLVRQIVEVLTIMQDLIDIVEKVYGEEQENKIYLLDKGSNTNIGLETGINTAKSLFSIFKEVWDWMVNRKYYKEKLRNAAFLDNLVVISKISEMINSGSLTEEDGLRYKELIIKNTDKLLSLNTIPRQILLDRGKHDEGSLLLDYNEVRLLKSGSSDIKEN